MDGRKLVKGKQFNAWRSVGVAAQAARLHAMRGVDELCLLDITATKEGRGPDLDLVRELSETMFMPLTVGGGVKSLDDARALLNAGADKVSVNSAGIKTVMEISGSIGCQAVVASIDVDKSNSVMMNGWSHSAIGAARSFEDAGAGEILLTSIEREGTMLGYDLDLIREVSHAVSIPVIANGGCGSYEHMLQAIEAGASAVAAGAFFQFTDATPKGAAQYLHQRGIEVRL
jgi:cyclase